MHTCIYVYYRPWHDITLLQESKLKAVQMHTIHLIHKLAILCLIPWIQEVVYLYMLIIVTCLIVSAGATSLLNVIEF